MTAMEGVRGPESVEQAHCAARSAGCLPNREWTLPPVRSPPADESSEATISTIRRGLAAFGMTGRLARRGQLGWGEPNFPAPQRSGLSPAAVVDEQATGGDKYHAEIR